MTDRETVADAPALGLLLGVALATALLVGAWLLLANGIGRPATRVNDHTDDSVPTVDLRTPSRPVTA